MPVPRRKTSRARRDNRRSHQRLLRPQVQKCPRCAAAKMAHRVCPSCGFYKDIEVVPVKEAS